MRPSLWPAGPVFTGWSAHASERVTLTTTGGIDHRGDARITEATMDPCGEATSRARKQGRCICYCPPPTTVPLDRAGLSHRSSAQTKRNSGASAIMMCGPLSRSSQGDLKAQRQGREESGSKGCSCGQAKALNISVGTGGLQKSHRIDKSPPVLPALPAAPTSKPNLYPSPLPSMTNHPGHLAKVLKEEEEEVRSDEVNEVGGPVVGVLPGGRTTWSMSRPPPDVSAQRKVTGQHNAHITTPTSQHHRLPPLYASPICLPSSSPLRGEKRDTQGS
ncbi:unnamed protein product [Lota lota]